MGTIYSLHCWASNSAYIGSTTRPVRRRFVEHCSRLRRGVHRNKHLQRAWNKYGEEVFECLVLDEVLDKDLYQAEQYWLDQALQAGDVYNMGACAANPMQGRTHTAAARAKISRANKGKQLSLWQRLRVSQTHKGKPKSKETRRRISEARRGKSWLTEDGLRRIAEARAKSYPAFRNVNTGDYIPSGRNLKALCQEWNLEPACMRRVVIGQQSHHKGWELA